MKKKTNVNTNTTSSQGSTLAKKKSTKNTKSKIDNLKIIKCKICQNPQTKTTFNFTCKHNLCGICVSHLLIKEDFKSLSEKEKIYLECSVCKSNEVEKIGIFETSLSDLSKLLDETYPIRNEKKKDLCTVHNILAENYCIQCKKWICKECKKSFHDRHFKDHTLELEEPFDYNICKIHSDKKMDLFCSDCQKEVCYYCSTRGEKHEGHKIITLDEHRKTIIKEKRRYKFKDYIEFDEFLKSCEEKFKKDFEKSFKIKQDLTNDIINLLQEFEKEYFSKKKEKDEFIENYFKIIRGCYFNYFFDLKIKEPKINTLNFINSVNKEISSINFQSEFTKDLEKIRENIQKINPKKFFKYEMKFLHHSLNCIKTIKEEKDNHIYCITQLKNGKIVTGGSQGVLNVWDLETLEKVDSFQAHEKNIYSVIQLTDGRLVSASGDLWIKFFDFENVTQSEPKIFDIIDQNKLNEIIDKKNKLQKKTKIKSKDSDVIILRGPLKNNINKKVDQNANIINNNSNNNNMNNNINNNINNNVNNNINTNANINQNINVNQNNESINLNQVNFKNVIIPNNNNNMNSNINSNIQPQNAPDVSYGTSGVQVLPQDISYGASGQSKNNALDVGYSGNGKENAIPQNQQNNAYSSFNDQKSQFNYKMPLNGNIIQPIVPDVGFGDSSKMNYNINLNNNIGNNVPDVAYSSSPKETIVQQKASDVPFGDSNINNNLNSNIETKVQINSNISSGISNPNPINNINERQDLNNKKTITSIKEEKEDLSQSKKIENEFDFPEEESYKKIDKLKESNIVTDEIKESINNSIIPANPPKNNNNSDNNNDEIAYSSKNGNITINQALTNYKGNRCLIALRGHYDDVFCLLETSKRQLVSCSKDGTILIWSIDNHSIVFNFEAHKSSVGCVIEIDENRIATGGADCKIKIWNISSNPQEEYTLSGHKNAVFSICKINENKIASASCDKTIRLWDLQQKKCICTFAGHMDYVWSVIKLKEENRIASASSDKKIKIWDVDELKCINTINAHNKDVTILALLSDGKIISGSMDMKIKIWEC